MKLNHSNYIGYKENYCDNILYLLDKYFETKLIAERSETEVIISYQGNWFALNDNGGEFNVSQINSNYTKSAAYTDENGIVDEHTMCSRILDALKFEEIDYTFFFDESDKEALA